jgi:hypothetical protein
MSAASRRVSRWLILTGSVAVLTGCLSATRQRPTTPAPCIRENQRDIVVRWGTEDDSLKTLTRFSVNTKGEVFRYSGPITDTISETYVTHLDASDYCDVAASVNTTFLKTQALSVRGKRARYIEYINPHTDVYLRAMWNPDLSTFQSRDMRAEYDRLMDYLRKY